MIWINDLPKKNLINYLINQNPLIKFNKKAELKEKLQELLESIQVNIKSQHFGKAIDLLSLGLYLEKDTFFELIKSAGILRNSSYLETKNPISGISSHLIVHKDFFRFNDEELLHLQSLNNSLILHKELRRLNSYINSELDKFKIAHNFTTPTLVTKQSKFKALLAINEVNFITNLDGERTLADYSIYEFHSKEEISSSISELIERYEKRTGIQNYDLNIVDAEYAQGNQSRELITATCQFLTLKNLEIEIENYGYQIMKAGDKILVCHPDQNFSKSMELSNIQYQFQQMANANISYKRYPNVPSLHDIASAFHKNFPDLFSYKTDPTPRYVLSVPIKLYEKLLGDPDIALFREEIGIFTGIQAEMLLTLEGAKTYKIRPELSYYNFLRLQRFFMIQAILLRQKLLDLINVGKMQEVYRSVVGIFKREDLITALQSIGTLDEVKAFLDILTWIPTHKAKTLDLQYKPFITKENYIIAPTSVIGKSNLGRNVFVSEAKTNNNMKATQGEKHISIAAVLKHGFENHGYLTEIEVPVKYKGSQNESDIDFMAFKDGILFIAECKDSTLPTDPFEMRTPYSNLKKAASQINYLKSALSDKIFQAGFCKKYNLSEIKQIIPVIVASNNKMWGSFLDGVSVRNVKELSAFLAHGTWTISEGDNVNIYQLWRGEKFDVNDLIDFCSDKSVHQAMFNACIEVRDSITSKILKVSYKLDLIKLTEEMKKAFAFTTKTAKYIENT
ncbi:hypothetical protein ACEN2P_08180 [Pedobacter psychrotolerans]|uniref:hypothetical protein n=1 Tax=Pedobacter psychrotolerans TaxID=1843235 RepID=UPI003F983FE5